MADSKLIDVQFEVIPEGLLITETRVFHVKDIRDYFQSLGEEAEHGNV